MDYCTFRPTSGRHNISIQTNSPGEFLLCCQHLQHEFPAIANIPHPPSYPSASSIQLRHQSIIVRQDCTWSLYDTNWGVSSVVFPAKERSFAATCGEAQNSLSRFDVLIKRTICSHTVNTVSCVIAWGTGGRLNGLWAIVRRGFKSPRKHKTARQSYTPLCRKQRKILNCVFSPFRSPQQFALSLHFPPPQKKSHSTVGWG